MVYYLSQWIANPRAVVLIFETRLLALGLTPHKIKYYTNYYGISLFKFHFL